ncbi:oxygen oxidoreductase [Myriangium duriaei CBS 260.36]|uniref:Oxygen oxidoreductase n=1 Tax=Myriangium duriaei CBS 260.36 TaxID=1168546 RepID=A0A9P4IZT9_9PEZI|nr:oxygen oxidoreductase [Myriangium duriaei CBS 260.36]
MPRNTSPINIVGAGAWGLSIALHLQEAGYTDITVFDRADTIPSRYSAAWDLNKIVRAEYEDPFYTDLALRAIERWKTPLFGPYFHQTGYIVTASGRAPEKAIHHLEAALSSVASHPEFAPEIRSLKDSKALRKYLWQATGPLNGFKGYFNRLAGYAHSSDALKGIWEYLASKGIKFVLGEAAGKVVSLSKSPSGAVVAVQTADGKTHRADKTIVAAGSYGATLVPDLGKFVTARCWSVAHVQLSEDECNYLRGMPTTNVRDLGFFFEPDPKTRLFKLCPLGTGYTNPGQDGTSLPPLDRLPPPQDFIPAEDEKKLRTLLREMFPWMADRPFVDQKLCWFADTADSEYCVDFVPGTDKSLVVVSGDSGHGFKMMPVFGEWVVDLLSAGEQKLKRWQWKTEDLRNKDWGEAVSWRIGTAKELKELIKEKDKLIRARL